MTPDDTATDWEDDPQGAAVVCALLQQARPNWRIWREAGLWQARRNTWPADEQPIFSADTAVLDSLMGAIDDNVTGPRRGGTT